MTEEKYIAAVRAALKKQNPKWKRLLSFSELQLAGRYYRAKFAARRAAAVIKRDRARIPVLRA